MTRLLKKAAPSNLTYLMCDDWLILAYDNEGNVYYVITETWTEWLDLPDNADQEPNAIEKYMLPIAKKRWNNLPWRKEGTVWDIWPENQLDQKFKEYGIPFNPKK